MLLRAPAKLNLFLEVLGKRPDGYHEIRTVMVPVSLYDDVRLRRAKRTRITFDPPVPGRTTVHRALDLVRRRTRFRGGVEIHVTKRIPMGAGLGGGSSDGAATLIGLNRLLRLRLDRDTLFALAARVGSDVPFFLAGGPALCAGRGERVTPLRLPRAMTFDVVMPDLFCSTPEIYRRLRLRGSPRRVDEFLLGLAAGKPRFFNRLEGPAFKLYPKLARLRRALGGDARMTGSGAALFRTARRTRVPGAWRVRAITPPPATPPASSA